MSETSDTTDQYEYQLLGWPADQPTLVLDHEQFAYAGKFRTGRTGIAVVRDESLLAAIAFNDDRGVDNALRIRYLTVREDCRGERIGPRLAVFLKEQAFTAGYDRVRVAVNNPMAFNAFYRAGFASTGEQRGLAEIVLEAPAVVDPDQYRSELAVFRERDLPAAHTRVIDRGLERGPPDPIELSAL